MLEASGLRMSRLDADTVKKSQLDKYRCARGLLYYNEINITQTKRLTS